MITVLHGGGGGGVLSRPPNDDVIYGPPMCVCGKNDFRDDFMMM